MRRAWMVPLVICLLLLSAWVLRWDREVIAGDVYVLDRWVNQWWVVDSQTGTAMAICAKVKEQRLLSGQQHQVKEEGIIERVAEWRQAVAWVHRQPAEELVGNQMLQEAVSVRTEASQAWGASLAVSILAFIFLYRRVYRETFWSPAGWIRKMIWQKYYSK